MPSFFDALEAKSVRRPVIANKEFSDGDWFLKKQGGIDPEELKDVSISHGTMRPEDLIPEFVAVLKQLDTDGEYSSLISECEALELEEEPGYGTYYKDEDAERISDLLNEGLFNALDQFAPGGYYFGSHPGDGSDYGFWQAEGDSEDEPVEASKRTASRKQKVTKQSEGVKRTAGTSSDDLERLLEIKQEIKNLIEEAYDIVSDTSEGDRAKGYWYAHIKGALDEDHAFLGGSRYTMQDTIDALEEDMDDDEEPDDDEPSEGTPESEPSMGTVSLSRTAGMDDSKFWEILNNAGGDKDRLAGILRANSLDDMMEFEDLFRWYQNQLFDVLAKYINQGGQLNVGGDDSTMDLAAGVMAAGKQAYDAVTKSPRKANEYDQAELFSYVPMQIRKEKQSSIRSAVQKSSLSRTAATK